MGWVRRGKRVRWERSMSGEWEASVAIDDGILVLVVIDG